MSFYPPRRFASARWARSLALALVPLTILAACSSDSGGGDTQSSAAGGPCTPPETPVVNFAAYSTPREAYGQIIPAFVSKWKEEHDDQNVIFQESYAGSTTQAANVIAGYEADVVALSLGPDVDEIADAGLITHDWTDQPDGGMVSTSVVVFDVRPGNPEGFQDWNDLAADGVEILTPDPASSGGARWNLVSLWGSALRGYAGMTADDTAGATTLMQDVLSNVIVFDKNARDSIQNFEAGNGDVAITYENEVLTAQEAGLEDEAVYPPSTVLIENPVAVVDQWVDEHCVRDVAEAFVEFLHSDEAKEIYTEVGHLRSTDTKEAQKGGGQFPPIEDLFTVDEIGGWDALNEELFSDSGIVTQAIAG
ncbi:MAG TPA: sulfate ABC transporter substrate-binding protein [Actinomycetota bacterium]|nr:sulfate ABC transporter substrate-binding protein [Actinomycetota bacterium]